MTCILSRISTLCITAILFHCHQSTAFLQMTPLTAPPTATRRPWQVTNNGFSIDKQYKSISFHHGSPMTLSSLSLLPIEYEVIPTSSLLLSSDESKFIAETLGYIIGAASVLLYTPIVVRILRTKSADGLTVSTWWFKLTSYTCTVVSQLFC